MTNFQKEVVETLKRNGRMSTEEIAGEIDRTEKSVYKALTYLHGAEVVRDYQKAPPKKVPFTEEEHEEWKKCVREWKESNNPEREDRWELLPEEEWNETLS